MNNRITKQHQESFWAVANQLIFLEPNSIKLTKKNARKISKLIQKECIDVFDKKHEKMFSYLDDILGHELTEEEKEKKKFSNLNRERTPRTLIEGVLNYFSISKFEESMRHYDHSRFTPKLAHESSTELGGMNCFGMNIFIGSLCKTVGIPVRLAITTDHPFIFAEVEKEICMIDAVTCTISPIPKEAELKFFKTYQLYSERKNEKLQEICFIHDFDDGVLYEILENLEALKQSVNGNKRVLLPYQRHESHELALKYRKILTKGDWREMQRILFPDIYYSFIDHQEMWLSEIESVRNSREKNNVYHVLCDIMKDGSRAARWNSAHMSQKEVEEIVVPLMLTHGEELGLALQEDRLPKGDIPENVLTYYNTLRNGVNSHPRRLAKQLRKHLVKKFIDNSSKKDTLNSNSTNSTKTTEHGHFERIQNEEV